VSGERAFFDEHGWVIVRGVVDAERVATLRAAFERVLPEGSYGRGSDVWQVPGRARTDETLARQLTDPALGRLAGGLLGCAEVRLLQDTLLLKPARTGGRVEWHQDYTYTGYLDPPRALSVRLALTACTADNGCLQVLDGSHRWGFVAPARILREARVTDALSALPPELAARVPSALRLVELEPGDVSVHHCLTLHASGVNLSAEARKTLIAHLFDGDCRLVRERLPGPEAAAYFPTDEHGRLIGPAFPTLFSR
jgi:ectoine hydroxylase-related dioxygenase (phytanoyl-CoA dioxygenase family)